MIDLVEQLVGDLGGEGRSEAKEIVRISADTWQVYGSANVKDVIEELEMVIPEENSATTFGGVITAELGSIPEDGSRTELVIDKFKITVNQVSEHRIVLTTVHKFEQ